MKGIASVFLVFLSGIGLNLTPCVYPLIPITVSYFGGRSGKAKGKPYIHGLFYILGIAITNSILSLFATMTGNILGSFLQNRYVLLFISLLLFLLSLSLFGYWEIRIPVGISKILSRQFSGYSSSFLIGLLFGIFAAPCAGPLIIGLMLYVLKMKDPFLGFIYFFSLSLGMGIPIGILATFSGMLSRLPSSGMWMIWVRKLFAWTLIFMAVYLLKPALGKDVANWLIVVILLFSGIHLGFFEKSLSNRILRWTFGIVLVLSSLYLGIFSKEKAQIKWFSYSDSMIKSKDKPIIIDFYADWCISCRKVDKEIFERPEMKRISKRFIMIRVDLTSQLPEQKRILNRFHIKGLPTILIISKDKTIRLEGEISWQDFLKRIKKVLMQYQTSDLSYLPSQSLLN